MATRNKTYSSVRPLGRLKSSLRRLQEEAEKLLDLPSGTTEESLEAPSQRRADRRGVPSGDRPAQGVREHREDLLAAVETQLTRRFGTLLERLDIPSRRDIEELSHRIDRLESALKTIQPRRPRSTKR